MQWEFDCRKRKMSRRNDLRLKLYVLLSGKGHTVGALLYRGIRLVGTHADLVERAVVLPIAVVLTLRN